MKTSALVILGILALSVATVSCAPAQDDLPNDLKQATAANGIYAVFHTSMGPIAVLLHYEKVPITVANFVGLAEGTREWTDTAGEQVTRPLYDGTIFHRVIKDFMIQGGDPNTRDNRPDNDGQGGPDLELADEFSDAPFSRGVVAMANRGRKNSAGSQFFIVHGDTPALVGQYTVIGRVRSGMEVVDAIVDVEIDGAGRWGPKHRPIENVVLIAVEDNAAFGQFAKGVEMMMPFPLRIEECLMTVFPELLDDRLERRPVM